MKADLHRQKSPGRGGRDGNGRVRARVERPLDGESGRERLDDETGLAHDLMDLAELLENLEERGWRLQVRLAADVKDSCEMSGDGE